jgi:hypothetical protein
MHRFHKWRELLKAARGEQDVEHLMREYVAAIDPIVRQVLPPEVRTALDDSDIRSAAVTILHAELKHAGPPEVAGFLHEIAHTYAAASLRLTRLGAEPVAPAAK